MSVHLVQAYAIAGLGVGAAVGLIVTAAFRPTISRTRAMRDWDAWVTVPLLLAAAGAHLILITQVGLQRQVLFGLYGVALIGTAVFAVAGLAIWRLAAVIFPAGSIAAYFYFALPEHQADYIGLLVKVVELAAIVAALVPVFARKRVPPAIAGWRREIQGAPRRRLSQGATRTTNRFSELSRAALYPPASQGR